MAQKPSEEAPAGGGTSGSESGFAGGFTGDTSVTVPGTFSTGPWGKPHVDPSVDTTLGELREIGRGGYLDSDQWLPANEDPASIAQLQTMLVEAGLLDLDDLEHEQLGFYDDATRGAFRDLLARSNAGGATWETTLTKMRRNPAAASRRDKGRERAPFVAQLTNAADIERGLHEFMREKIGRGLKKDQLAPMVKAYQDQELAAQKALYDAQETGGTVTAPPDFETFADQQAQLAAPTAYSAHKVLDKFSTVASMLRGERA